MNQILQHMKSVIYHKQFRLILVMQGWFNIQELVIVIHQINTIKKRNDIYSFQETLQHTVW